MRTAALKKPAKPNFRLEDAGGVTPCCGIDEAGRGPLAGPVVAAAIILDRQRLPRIICKNINDSKKLTAKKREELAAALADYADIGIGVCSVEEIDSLNILRASLEAMRRAHALLSGQPVLALIDGNQKPPITGCTLQTIVGGDARSVSIAAASIIAKVHRDRMMVTLAEQHPHYGWSSNVGYSTEEHLKALEIHGVTVHHRRSFAPVSKLLLKANSANY
jgi:ribonuclease HII